MSDEQRLLNCFRRIFPKLTEAEIRQASMRRLGAWDSAALLALIAGVEGEFAVRFDPRQVNALVSFEAMLAVLRGMTPRARQGAGASSTATPAARIEPTAAGAAVAEPPHTLDTAWVTGSAPRAGVRLRLFCFPHAGSSAAAFASWSAALPPEIDVRGVEYPGRGSRRAERPFVRMRALIAAAVTGLMPALTAPFAILGHSLGALIAFELLRQFARQGGPEPLGLLVAGCRAPSLPPPRPPIYALSEDELVQELESLNGTSPDILGNPEFRRIFLPALRADLELGDTYVYRPGPPLGCPVFAYGGRDDEEARPEELEAWGRVAVQPPTLRVYPGDHFFLRTAEEAFLSDLAQDLSSLMTAAACR